MGGAILLIRSALGQRNGTDELPAESTPLRPNNKNSCTLRLATNAAGNAGLKFISEAWREDNHLAFCELAFGLASAQVCENAMEQINASADATAASALRSAAPSSIATEPIETTRSTPPESCAWIGLCDSEEQEPKVRLCATPNFPRYLEEVLFPRLMLRCCPYRFSI